MKKNIIILLIALVSSLVSCTDNSMARHWGGTEEVKLKPNEIVVGVTWKDESELWVCTTDTVTGITYFREHSSMGVMEGQVIFQPTK